MSDNPELIAQLKAEFIATNKFKNIAQMFTKNSLKEMGYADRTGKIITPITEDNLSKAIDDYLLLNIKYLNQLIKNSEILKNINLNDYDQSKLSYSLFVEGVGATFKKLKANEISKISKVGESQSTNLELQNNEVFNVSDKGQLSEIKIDDKPKNILSEVAPAPEQESEYVPKSFDVKARLDEAEEKSEKQAEEEEKINQEIFKFEYKDKYKKTSHNFQLTPLLNATAISSPALGLQAGFSYMFMDATNLDKLAKNKDISGRLLSNERQFVSLDFAIAARPTNIPLAINGGNENTNLQNNFSTLRLLDSFVKIRFKPNEDSKSQIGINLGPNIYFNGMFTSQNLIYDGIARCPCAGVCLRDKKNITLVSAVNSYQLWKFPEYGQIASANFSSKNHEFSFGYKPQGLNLDQSLVSMISGVPASAAQLSSTLTAYAATIGYDKFQKVDNVSYVSFIRRPDANSRLGFGHTGKNEKIGYEAGVDFVSNFGNAKSLGMALVDAGITIPIKKKNVVTDSEQPQTKKDVGLISFSTTFGKNYQAQPNNNTSLVSSETAQNVFSFKAHSEYYFIKKDNLNLKGLVGVSISNIDHSKTIPPQSTEKFSFGVYGGLQLNLTKK